MKKISGELADDIHACITDKKNPGKCIDKALDEHGFDQSDKSAVLTKILKDDE